MLAAHNFGLGSCWIHRAKEEFESEKGKATLKKLGINGEYAVSYTHLRCKSRDARTLLQISFRIELFVVLRCFCDLGEQKLREFLIVSHIGTPLNKSKKPLSAA